MNPREGKKMSVNEVKEAFEENVPLDPEDFIKSRDAIEEAGFRGHYACCFLIPKDLKMRIRVFVNNLVQMVCNATMLEADDRLLSEIRSLTQALSHLLNSQSFEDNKLYDFDKRTIDGKLGRLRDGR